MIYDIHQRKIKQLNINNISFIRSLASFFSSVPSPPNDHPSCLSVSFSLLLICSHSGFLPFSSKATIFVKKRQRHNNAQQTPHSIRNSISWKSRGGEREGRNMRRGWRKGREGKETSLHSLWRTHKPHLMPQQ